VTQLYDAAISDTALRLTQFTLLQALELSGPSPQARLGELLALDPTTLSRTLRPVARAGWIRTSR
jgi:DNA-binding MarR family transcriptional regulator